MAILWQFLSKTKIKSPETVEIPRLFMAEDMGLEPTGLLRLTWFPIRLLSHSVNPPHATKCIYIQIVLNQVNTNRLQTQAVIIPALVISFSYSRKESDMHELIELLSSDMKERIYLRNPEQHSPRQSLCCRSRCDCCQPGARIGMSIHRHTGRQYSCRDHD